MCLPHYTSIHIPFDFKKHCEDGYENEQGNSTSYTPPSATYFYLDANSPSMPLIFLHQFSFKTYIY